MGKIKIATLGTEEEEKLKEKEKVKREQKKLREGSTLRRSKTDEGPAPKGANDKRKGKVATGTKGGERIPSMAPSEEEIAEVKAKEEIAQEEKTEALKEETREETPKTEKKSKEKETKRTRSRRYNKARTFVDKTKLLNVKDAIDLVKKTSYTKFDGSVETHINTLERGIKVNLTFPHSTGKTTRVAIVNDEIISDIDRGIANFDVLIATPEFMPKLAKYAKFLGPKGLMPNPKAGTVTTDPKAVAKKYEAGEVTIKTESDQSIIHTVIGKVSGENKSLEENLNALISAVGPSKIRSVFVKATMGPSVRIDLGSI